MGCKTYHVNFLLKNKINKKEAKSLFLFLGESKEAKSDT